MVMRMHDAPPPPEPLVKVRVLHHAIQAAGRRVDVGATCELPRNDALGMARAGLVELLEQSA
jgi:hypothetical protein